MSDKTAFISYRRDPLGKAFARGLKQELTRHGYDVFLDVDGIDAGYWEQQIITQVPKRSHFLVLLTPGALDRCEFQDDWMRREFELAMQSGRNVVPVLEESVEIDAMIRACPGIMKPLFSFQVARMRNSRYVSDIEELMCRYLAPHMVPTDSTAQDSVDSSSRYTLKGTSKNP